MEMHNVINGMNMSLWLIWHISTMEDICPICVIPHFGNGRIMSLWLLWHISKQEKYVPLIILVYFYNRRNVYQLRFTFCYYWEKYVCLIIIAYFYTRRIYTIWDMHYIGNRKNVPLWLFYHTSIAGEIWPFLYY